ncbi:hypothetical protein MTO96_036968 [Rhipicephalus appendiculatus]
MSTITTQADASEDSTSKSSSANRVVRASDVSGFDRSLLEMMDLSLQDLQLLSELDDEGPLAPANSLESLVEDSHGGPSDDTALAEKWRSSFCALQRATDQVQTVKVTGERSITVDTSEEDEAQRPSYQASAASLVCVAMLMVAFLLAVAYGVVFNFDHIPVPDKMGGTPTG